MGHRLIRLLASRQWKDKYDSVFCMNCTKVYNIKIGQYLWEENPNGNLFVRLIFYMKDNFKLGRLALKNSKLFLFGSSAGPYALHIFQIRYLFVIAPRISVYKIENFEI